MSLFIRVFHNTDHACVVWGPDDPREALPDCLGFAIRRRKVGDTSEGEALHNFTSFDLDNQKPGTSAESTVWPVQRFNWWDYAPNSQDAAVAFEYKIVPLTKGEAGFAYGEKPLPEMPHLATDWKGPLNVSQDCGDGISCYFNRGIVAAEWVSRALKAKETPGEAPGKALEEAIKTPGDKLRVELGGVLKTSLLKVLADVLENKG